jgi:allophanate hydrolase subunit 2
VTLRVVRALGLVTVQDLGRPGWMHQGLAAGGALVPGLLVAANRAVGNPDGAPALEVCGRLELVATAGCVVATPAPTALAAGQSLVVVSEPHRVVYLALAGGVDAPLVLGGRATQLSAGLGAPIRAGAELTPLTGSVGGAAATVLPASPGTGPVRVVPGPDRAAFAEDALARLCATPYRLSPRSDRVGTRLIGPALPRRPGLVERPRPLVVGAIEVPGDGAPIVLGPEHPTTGGYPVIAVVCATDRDRFFSTRLGGVVHFTRVGA